MRKCLILALTTVGAFLLLAGNALAGTQSAKSPSAMGYCGPPVTSKQAMIGYYMYNSTARMHAEHYVRAHAKYYHIQADQSFLNWLQQPNVKFFKAPAGYKLTGNTYCLNDGTVLPYHGHYSVGGLGMLWWCANAKGKGHDCTPITKGYCRNFVHGRKIHPSPKPKPHKPRKPHKPVPKPKPTPKATPPASCTVTINNSTVTGDVTNCSTVTITVVCGNVSKTFTGPNAQDAQEQAYSWQQANCTSSPPPCNCSPPPPPPPSVCPPGTSGTPPACSPLPSPPSVTITSVIDLNDVPIGKNSGQLPVTVNASAPGSLTIDPGNGGISACNSSTPLSSLTLSFGAGTSTLCVIYYAPQDATATKGSITYTAIVTTSGGTAKDVKTDPNGFDITNPSRPG